MGGELVQLVERLLCKQEVKGSTPLLSTKSKESRGPPSTNTRATAPCRTLHGFPCSEIPLNGKTILFLAWFCHLIAHSII